MMNKITIAAISVATVSAIKIESQAGAGAEAGAQVEWKLWKNFKNTMEKFGNTVADTAEDFGEGVVDIVENPDKIVTFLSYAQTEGILDTL